MSALLSLLSTFVNFAAALVAALVGYLQLLTAAACFAPRKTAPRNGPPTSRFVIMVPAHNEEQLLPQLLESLNALDYPRELFSVHVVADNCSDGTAAQAIAHGAIAHERFNTELRGKGYALEWLLQQIWERDVPHDAVLILDADSVVSPNFLSVMDARLARGERVIQAYYAVLEPRENPSAGIRAVALVVLHYLRPQGRMVLGGSTGLKGNGMVFTADILRKHRWTASLTEDIEYHMELILAGERAMFAPDAVVWAEMPATLKAAQTQNERWERGRMEMIKRFVPGLLRKAGQRRSFLLFDAALEQLIPPFSVLVGLSGLVFGLSVAVRSALAIKLSLFAIVGQVVYIFAGLALARAPRRLYKALLFAPAFLAWKLWLYARLLIGIKPEAWIRTARNEP